MKLRRIRAVARKELLHILRDVRSLLLALALPVLMLVMFGYALSLDVERIPTAFYDADRSVLSGDLVEDFSGSRFFKVGQAAASLGEMERMIEEGGTMLGISIPQNFGGDIKTARPVEVQLLLDGSDSNTAAIALGYAEAVVAGYSARVRGSVRGGAGSSDGSGMGSAPIDVRIRALYNSDLKSRNYIIPGLIAVILMIIATLLTSLTIAREWELGMMETLLSTAVRPAEIVLGKMAAYFCLGTGATVVALVTGIAVFRVPFRGSPFVLAVSLGLFLCAALFWGLFVSAFAKNQLLALQMSMVSSFLPAFLLSGFVYAIESMPWIIQQFTLLIPARHIVTILKGVFLKGVGFGALWGEVVFLLLFGVVVFWATTRQLRAKLDQVS